MCASGDDLSMSRWLACHLGLASYHANCYAITMMFGGYVFPGCPLQVQLLEEELGSMEAQAATEVAERQKALDAMDAQVAELKQRLASSQAEAKAEKQVRRYPR